MKFKRELLRTIKRNKRLLRGEKRFLRSLKTEHDNPLLIFEQCACVDYITSYVHVLSELKKKRNE